MGELPVWPDGERGPYAFNLAPPTPVKPRPGVAVAYQEGIEMHGTAFVVLHGRTCYSAAELRRYAAAVLAAATVMEEAVPGVPARSRTAVEQGGTQ